MPPNSNTFPLASTARCGSISPGVLKLRRDCQVCVSALYRQKSESAVLSGARPPNMYRPGVLSAYRGHAVLLNFVSVTCAPCLPELPILCQIAHTYKTQGVIVRGIDSGGDTAVAAQEFARAANLDFPIAADPNEAV